MSFKHPLLLLFTFLVPLFAQDIQNHENYFLTLEQSEGIEEDLQANCIVFSDENKNQYYKTCLSIAGTLALSDGLQPFVMDGVALIFLSTTVGAVYIYEHWEEVESVASFLQLVNFLIQRGLVDNILFSKKSLPMSDPFDGTDGQWTLTNTIKPFIKRNCQDPPPPSSPSIPPKISTKSSYQWFVIDKLRKMYNQAQKHIPDFHTFSFREQTVILKMFWIHQMQKIFNKYGFDEDKDDCWKDIFPNIFVLRKFLKP